jgi:cobaltochelatase CobS
MAKISGSGSPIDVDVLNSILNEAQGGAKKKEEATPKKDAEPIPLQDGQVYFSSVFWKPVHIPDIPINVFKDEDWNEVARVMIPEKNPHWVWPEKTTELFAMAMFCNDTTLLHGLQGTGKSEIPAQWCAKFRIPMWRMSCHEQTREEHFVGSVSVSYSTDEHGNTRMAIQQEPSILTDSIKHGGFFVEDEAFRHTSALVLQSLREKNTRKLILPDAPGRSSSDRVLKADARKWRYILTDNTAGSGDTTGLFQAHVQDASTLDRVTVAIEVDYLPKKGEKRILASAYPSIPKEIVDKMIEFANQVRSAFRSKELQATLSVRGLLAWAEKYALMDNSKLALSLSWASKLSEDNLAKVSDMYHQSFGDHLK